MKRPVLIFAVIVYFTFATLSFSAAPRPPKLILNDMSADNHEALQAMFNRAHAKGDELVFPNGFIACNGPITLNYRANAPHCMGIRGVGSNTQFVFKNLKAGEAGLNFVANNNPDAACVALRDFLVLLDKSCDKTSACLRLGDSRSSRIDRVWLYGPNGLRLKLSGAKSYAQICTLITQLTAVTNASGYWGDENKWTNDNPGAFTAVDIESNGNQPDRIDFQSCEFRGTVRVYGREAFRGCCFSTPPGRRGGYGANLVYTGGGQLSVDDCYFEDHSEAIAVADFNAAVQSISVRNSHFSGTTNWPGIECRRAIDIEPSGKMGLAGNVVLENLAIGDGVYAQPPVFINDKVKRAMISGLYPLGADNVRVDVHCPVHLDP